jgi:PhnB protein
MPDSGGRARHAEMGFRDSLIMLSDEVPGSGLKATKSQCRMAASGRLYVRRVDATFRRGVEAGAQATHESQVIFWGDRFGSFTEPFGHSSLIAIHVERVRPDGADSRRQVSLDHPAQGKGETAAVLEASDWKRGRSGWAQ